MILKQENICSKQKIGKTSSKVAIGVANSKIVKTANPTWKSVQFDEEMHEKY